MNLAGVEAVFELEGELARMRRRMRNMERQAERMRRELEQEVERVRKSFKAELVPYQPPEQALMPPPGDGEKTVRIRIERRSG
jgi:hypothetical protein